MENTLPKNWVETKLGKVADLSSGYGFPIKYQGFNDYNIPFFKVGDISQNFKKGNVFLKECNNFINEHILKSIKAKKISNESIVFAKIGEAIRLNRRAITSTDCVIDNNVMALKFAKNVLFKYGYYFFETVKLIDLSAGNAVPSIRKSVVEEISFPLPPLAEQERIVAKLDALFAQQEVMKKALSRIPDLLKDFRQQVLTQAVTGKLTESWREGKELEEWKEVELQEVCTLKAGKFVAASEISNEKQDGYYPCYGANGLRGYVKTFTHIGKYSLIGRQGALCGNVHLIDGQFHATEHALVVTPIKTIDNIWMFYKLTSLELINYAKGVAQPGLSVMNLNPIPINIPPFEEQQEIVSRVETLFAKTDAIEERYKNLKEKIDTLPQAILHKAFKGELVAQLSTDGDAKDLLKEIMALKNEVKKK